jgi:hypothetical protein
MHHSASGPNSNLRQTSLEEWLQLPDPEQPPALETAAQPEVVPASIPAPEPSPSLFTELGPIPSMPSPELFIVGSSTEKAEPGEPAPPEPGVPEADLAALHAAEVRRLEKILFAEFSDTLTGFNSASAPIGLGLIIVSLAMWLLLPLARFLTPQAGLGGWAIWVLVAAVVLGLAGLHFLLYWGAHRGSNIAKTRELDRLIEDRRVTNPCANLDCVEGAKPLGRYAAPISRPGSKLASAADPELRWRCELFDIDLEGMPVCAVCDRYQPRQDSSNQSDSARKSIISPELSI